MISDYLLRLAINRISVLRPSEKRQLEEIVDSESFFLALTPALLSGIVGREITHMYASGEERLRAAERDARYLYEQGAVALCTNDLRYPAALLEIFDPPYLLYVRGSLPSQSVPAVAVVGTRDPGARAVLAARRLASDLAANAIPVISGLARGIDVAAHAGALEHGVTGAILGCGIDMVTPSSHRGLAAEILETGGFLASEYAPATPPHKYHFPARNRIISGLSRGVVVVQAPMRSGALITADYALDQGRDLFVHRDGLEPPTGAGTADLAADGARIVESATDILDEWGIDAGTHPDLVASHALVSISDGSAGAGAARAESVRRALYGEAPR